MLIFGLIFCLFMTLLLHIFVMNAVIRIKYEFGFSSRTLKVINILSIIFSFVISYHMALKIKIFNV